LGRRARLLIGLGVALTCCQSAPDAPSLSRTLYVAGRYVMGTVLEVQVFTSGGETARAASSAVFAETARLEAALSHYRPETDVSRLSRTAGTGPQEVAPEVTAALQRALELGVLTQGAFDITLGPVFASWRESSSGEPSLAALRARVGHDKIVVDPAGRVALRVEGMALDLGAFAKGWSLDRAVALLRERAVDTALLSFGQSSVWALGAPPGTEGWTLALQAPGGGVQGWVTLRDRALSFSSSRVPAELRSAADPPGRAPLVDPRTLRPVRRQATATLVGEDGALADALSTALLVLPPAQGRALVESLSGVEAMVVEEDGAVWASSRWQAWTRYRSARD